MSEFDDFMDPEKYGCEAAFTLAAELEEAARSFSLEYRSGLADSMSISQRTTDIGGEIEAKVTFTANRMTGFADIGAEVPVEYIVETEFKCYGLTKDSFPDYVWDLLIKTHMTEGEEDGEYVPDEDWIDMLHDEDTNFEIAYRHGHTITTEGNVYFHEWLVAYVEDEEIYLPTHRKVEISDTENNTEGLATSEHNLSDLEAILSPEDIACMRDIGNVVLAEHRPTKLIDDLYDQIETVRFRTNDMRVIAARNVVKEIFPQLGNVSADEA